MTAREQLDKCLDVKNELTKIVAYNTSIGPKIKSLIDGVNALIPLSF